MTYSTTATFSEEQAKLTGTKPIEMYVVNASYSGWDPVYMANYNQDVYGYEMNASGDLVATEQVYTAAPIARGEIETNNRGNIPEITLTVPNVDRTIESLIHSYNYFRGRDIHFITTFTTYLPSGSTADYIGETPDRHAALKEKLYVDSTTSNEEAVSFSCRPKFSIKDMRVPGRRFTRECSWEYRDANCAMEATHPVSSPFSTCNQTLTQCKERGNTRRYGGFVGVPRRGIFIT